MNQKLDVTRRDIAVASLNGSVKIVHISDIHEVSLPTLAGRIKNERPDIILVSGDVFDRRTASGSPFLALLESLEGKFPVYMSLGNHEADSALMHPSEYRAFRDKLDELGVTVLDNSCVELTINDCEFYLYGITVEDKSKYKGSVADIVERVGEARNDKPAVVLCHYPQWFDALCDWGASLVLSGHVHGGVLRLPNGRGLFSPNGRGFLFFPKWALLPKYDGGIFVKNGSVMCLCRGFGKTKLPLRFNNPPNIAVLTVSGHGVNTPDYHESTALTVLKLAVSAALAVLSLVCLPGVYHIGAWLPLIFTAVFLPLMWNYHSIHRRFGKAAAAVKAVVLSVLCVCAVYTVVTTGMMIAAACTDPPPNATLIVLGAQVREDGPSLMLRRRLDAALDYLNDNPEACVIVSGGQGSNEGVSEGEAMRDYLTEHGIEPSRVYVEEASRNTFENMQFSADIIAQNGLSEQTAVVTDGFHQLRAKIFAEQNGLKYSAVPSYTPYYLLPSYWVREELALVKAFVFKR